MPKTSAKAQAVIRPNRLGTWVWLFLLGLTLVTYNIGEQGGGGQAIAVFLIFTMLLKGQLVAGFFMGLRQAPLFWRSIMTIYLVSITSLIGLAYWLGMS
jgi:hypothetical protein